MASQGFFRGYTFCNTGSQASVWLLVWRQRGVGVLDDFALLLVDDHPLFRDGLVAALRHHVPRLRVQAVGALAEALEVLATDGAAFDLVLLDYRLPGRDGLQCAQVLMHRHPGVAVALMSGLDDPTLAPRARAAGLCAYLPKTLELPVLLQHLQRLAQGEPVFDADTHPLTDGIDWPDELASLTARQREVLQALASGESNKELGRLLGIAPATVKKHLQAIFTRLGAANRTQAVLMARALLGEPPP